MRVIAFWLCLLLMPHIAVAHIAGEGSQRATYDFNAQWRLLVGDPKGAENADFDDSAWKPVTLPHAWNEDDAFRRSIRDLPTGIAWYRKRFTLRAGSGGEEKKLFLEFQGVRQAAEVFINGEFVGRHEGGFTPFAFEVTKLLRQGENRVTVGADAERGPDTIPPTVTDWETYGGITRPVHLVITPETYVDDAWIRLTRTGRIAVTVRLDGPSAAGRLVRVRIPALDFELEGRAGNDGSWAADAPTPPGLKLWSPDSPQLYDVVFEAGDDILHDRVGFRTIEVRGTDILLNGKPIFLRGISMHEEEFGKEPTRAITPATASALLGEIKHGLNANFVRLAHYPHSEVMTRTADELGLLVWSEIPVYWRINFARAETLATARRMLAENILRDRNRASIILWSVANETPLSDARNSFLATLARDVRTLDDSRLVTAALLTDRREKDGHVEMVLNDPLVAQLDVMAINTYNGWYSPDPLAKLPDIVWNADRGKPLIFSEFGADALAGFHDPALKRKFSEEYQAEYYRQTLKMSEKIPYLRGLSPWIFKDFRSPRRQHPVYQQGWNRKGVVSETGQRKQAFTILSDYYRSQMAAGR